MRKFRPFTIGELEALRPAMDTLAPQVAIGKEPHTSIFHEFANELAARHNQTLLTAKRFTKGSR